MRGLKIRDFAALLGAVAVSGQFLKAAPHYSRDEMRAWQWKRLRRLVRHAFETVPFYRDLYAGVSFEPADLRSWKDFHRLPTVSKDQLIANFPDRMLARGNRLDDLFVSRSSGSTGKVLDVAYDRNAVAVYVLAGLRMYRMGFPYRAWHRQLYVYTGPYPARSILGLYRLDFVPTLAPIAEIVGEIKRRRPHLLVCYPSHLKQIDQSLTERDLAEIHLRFISVNSEMSTQAERDHFARRFGCPVLDDYSSEELTRIAAQCRAGTYHVFEDINYLEVKSDADATDPSGAIIGTNLHNYAMPLIRYEQDDLGEIAETTCSCGWKFRALTDLQGRRNDSFVLPSGRTVSSGFLLDATYELLLTHREAVKDFCLIQLTRQDISLEIVPGSGWNTDVRAAVEDRFRGFFEPGVRFSATQVAVCTKTRTGKRNPIISLVKRGE